MASRVRIIRNDATSPVVYEGVKHAWRQGDELVLSLGEHGVNRLYIHWPIYEIDHYEVEEMPGEHTTSGVRA